MSVFAVYIDGRTHILTGECTTDILRQADALHPNHEEVRMIRCSGVVEASTVINTRYRRD